jgi:hypothetical protein
MRHIIFLVLLVFTVSSALAESLGPCMRSPYPSSGAIDLDVVRCQIALDAQRMGEMESSLNAAIAALKITKADLAATEAQKTTLIEWLKAAQAQSAVPVVSQIQK